MGKENAYHWVKELVETCKGFEPHLLMRMGEGPSQATIGFEIREWLNQGIGVRKPIQFDDRE